MRFEKGESLISRLSLSFILTAFSAGVIVLASQSKQQPENLAPFTTGAIAQEKTLPPTFERRVRGFSEQNAHLLEDTETISLSLTERDRLVTLSLDSSYPADQRAESIYTLSLAGANAAPELAKIAGTSLPLLPHADQAHSADSVQKNIEMNLRVMALEALDRLPTSDDIEVNSLLKKIMRKQREPTLRFLAQASLSGRLQRKPHRLSRIIDLIGTPEGI